MSDLDLTGTPDQEIIGAVMEHIRLKINAVFEQADVSLPDRQYLTVGAEAHDCEQLTVSFRQMYLGGPGDQAETPQKCNSPRSIVLTIQLVRKVAMPPSARNTTPAASAINDVTLGRVTDAWLLMDAAQTAPDDYLGMLADVAITDPSGEYQAIVLNMTVGVP